MKGIPYRYDHNFNMIVDTADLFRSKGFQKQLEACVMLDTIRKKGYEAHGKGHALKDNPHQSKNRREAWKNGWQEAESDYMALLSSPEAIEHGRDAAIEHITNLLSKDRRLVLHVTDAGLTWTILDKEPHEYLKHPKEPTNA